MRDPLGLLPDEPTDLTCPFPTEADDLPKFPPCPRCFMLAAEVRIHGRLEIWCGFCGTVAEQRPKPRGAFWEARGHTAHLGEAKAWNLTRWTLERWNEANRESRERRAAFNARMLEKRLREARSVEEFSGRRF